MQVVQRLIARAIRDGFAASNPTDQVELPGIKAVRPIRPFSRDEVKIIFQDHFRRGMTHREQVAATSRYPLLATLWFTGLRVSDVITLMATDVNLDQRVIIKQVKKTGKTLRVPLADTLVEILTPILPRSGPVFPKYCPGDSHKRRTGIERNLNHQIQSILKRHNLQHGSLHSFRHGFNQRLFELGLQLEDRQVLLGHSAGGTTRIYTHPNEDLARQYLNKL
ncbi:Tyrosine recombinase XerD [subsurface metagenome]